MSLANRVLCRSFAPHSIAGHRIVGRVLVPLRVLLLGGVPVAGRLKLFTRLQPSVVS